MPAPTVAVRRLPPPAAAPRPIRMLIVPAAPRYRILRRPNDIITSTERLRRQIDAIIRGRFSRHVECEKLAPGRGRARRQPLPAPVGEAPLLLHHHHLAVDRDRRHAEPCSGRCTARWLGRL